MTVIDYMKLKTTYESFVDRVCLVSLPVMGKKEMKKDIKEVEERWFIESLGRELSMMDGHLSTPGNGS